MSAKKQITFEKSLRELESLVDELEGGKLGLEEGVGRYQAGVELLKELHESLAKAEAKVEEMTAILQEGIADLEDEAGDGNENE